MNGDFRNKFTQFASVFLAKLVTKLGTNVIQAVWSGVSVNYAVQPNTFRSQNLGPKL